MNNSITSLERVLTTLSYKEADRVPMFLLCTFYGAKMAGVSIPQYFSAPELVAEMQLNFLQKFGNDCLFNFSYASAEIEAFGGDTIFVENGPPNAGKPFIQTANDIHNLRVPEIENAATLQNVLKITKLLYNEQGGKVPIIGVVMSPFSIPVMQMGFDKYLDLIYYEPELFKKLMDINIQFCQKWANAQIEAGATAICYFDPVSSSDIIPTELYKKTGFQVAKQTLAGIKSPTATHFAAGRSMKNAELITETGTNIISASTFDNLEELKMKVNGKLTVLGNLNGIEMCRWSANEAEIEIKKICKAAAKGGGFIIADNHGEIPWQVPEDTLLAISDAVKKWGSYPIVNE